MTEPDIPTLRVELAAALRWAARLGLHEGICNHFSVAVSPAGDRFLVNPLGVHWREMRASDIVLADADGSVIDGRHEVEPTAFFIHSRMHVARPSARVVLHTHMPYATALTMVEGGRLEMAGQTALKFYDRVAYDEDYNGLALDSTEGDRLAASMGDRDIAFLAAHGVIVTGPTLHDAFDDLYYLERACQSQVLAQSTGLPLKIVPTQVAQRTARQMSGESGQARRHFEALQRMLDREEPEYRA